MEYYGDRSPVWAWFNEDHAYLERPLGMSFQVRLKGCPHFLVLHVKENQCSKKCLAVKSILILQESYKLKGSLCEQHLLHRLRPTRRAISESSTKPTLVTYTVSSQPTLNSVPEYATKVPFLNRIGPNNPCHNLCFFWS